MPNYRPIKQCTAPSCRQTWPTPQVTLDKRRIDIATCPKCGGEGKPVGSCEYPG